MRDMQGVNSLNQLMNNDYDGNPTALGYWFIHSS